jgi:hypothetical protein
MFKAKHYFYRVQRSLAVGLRLRRLIYSPSSNVRTSTYILLVRRWVVDPLESIQH